MPNMSISMETRLFSNAVLAMLASDCWRVNGEFNAQNGD